MKSHCYHIQRSDLLTVLGLPLAGVLLLGFIVHASTWLPLGPEPRPTLDVDRTVIVQQIDSSEKITNAETVLIGDSSCLMNVDASYLQELTKTTVINLGTLSFLDLRIYARLLEHYLEHQSTPPKQIILLAHPDFVRKNSTSRAHIECFEHYLRKQDQNYTLGSAWAPGKYLGTYIVEGRLLARLPLPLNKAFGQFYGFTSNLSTFMDQHRGSAIDPRSLRPKDLTGSSDYRVATSHKRLADSLLKIIPAGTKLYVGLTPVPKSFPKNDFTLEYQRLLSNWSALFPECVPLAHLPPVLDDDQFATKTHLTQSAATDYTRTLLEGFEIDETP